MRSITLSMCISIVELSMYLPCPAYAQNSSLPPAASTQVRPSSDQVNAKPGESGTTYLLEKQQSNPLAAPQSVLQRLQNLQPSPEHLRIIAPSSDRSRISSS